MGHSEVGKFESSILLNFRQILNDLTLLLPIANVYNTRPPNAPMSPTLRLFLLWMRQSSMQRTVEELGRHHSEWAVKHSVRGIIRNLPQSSSIPIPGALVLYPIISLVTFVSWRMEETCRECHPQEIFISPLLSPLKQRKALLESSAS